MNSILLICLVLVNFFGGGKFGGAGATQYIPSGPVFPTASSGLIATYASIGCINSPGGSGTTITCTLSGSITSGQTGLLQLTFFDFVATATCADSLGNTWSVVPLASGAYPTSFNGGNGTDYVFYSHITTGGTDTITCTTSTSVDFPTISSVILNNASASPIQTASSVDNPSVVNGTPYSGANVTTTLAGGLGVCFSAYAGGGVTISAGTSPQVMTLATAATIGNIAAEYGNFVSTGTNHCQFTVNAGGDTVTDTIAVH